VAFSFFAYRLPITAEGRAPTSAESNPLPQGDSLVLRFSQMVQPIPARTDRRAVFEPMGGEPSV